MKYVYGWMENQAWYVVLVLVKRNGFFMLKTKIELLFYLCYLFFY